MTEKITLAALNALSPADFVARLGGLVEHSPWAVEAVASKRPFASLAAFADAVEATLREAPVERQIELLRAHPDLAGKAARAGEMTDFSKAEQAGAGLSTLGDAEFARFERLNGAYRARFGIPFIVCVRRHRKDSILAEFERRLRNEPDAERTAALDEVVRIVRLRMDGAIDAPDRLKVAGRVSTHVLDGVRGKPAAGVRIEFFTLAQDGGRALLKSVETNADGRTDEPLIGGGPVPIGLYEIVFHVGDHFRRIGVALPTPAFIDAVPIRFGVAEPEGHYHVPLLATPWTYSTYRGS